MMEAMRQENEKEISVGNGRSEGAFKIDYLKLRYCDYPCRPFSVRLPVMSSLLHFLSRADAVGPSKNRELHGAQVRETCTPETRLAH